MSTSPSSYADSSVSISPPPPPLSLPQKPDLPPSKPKTHVLWSRHTLKQLQLVLPGAALTYYLGTIHVFLNILHGSGGFWARCGHLTDDLQRNLYLSYYRTGAIAASGLGLMTITLFSYVLFLPWFTGQELNVRTLLSMRCSADQQNSIRHGEILDFFHRSFL